MDEQTAFLAAIADRPDDDTPRLVYADWLDDHSDAFPDPAATRLRAEFIRIQCELKRLEHLPRAELERYVDLYRRQDALLTLHRRDLIGPVHNDTGPLGAVFDRGLLTELTLTDYAFVHHAASIDAMRPRPDVAVVATSLNHDLLRSPHVGLVTAAYWKSFDRYDEIEPVWPRWERLRVLNMSGSALYDGGLSVFVDLRADDYPALTELDLSWNGITDEGVHALVSSRLWPRLRVLVLGGNPITDAGAELLTEARPGALKYVNLQHTELTDVGRNRLLSREGWKVDLF